MAPHVHAVSGQEPTPNAPWAQFAKALYELRPVKVLLHVATKTKSFPDKYEIDSPREGSTIST